MLSSAPCSIVSNILLLLDCKLYLTVFLRPFKLWLICDSLCTNNIDDIVSSQVNIYINILAKLGRNQRRFQFWTSLAPHIVYTVTIKLSRLTLHHYQFSHGIRAHVCA